IARSKRLLAHICTLWGQIHTNFSPNMPPARSTCARIGQLSVVKHSHFRNHPDKRLTPKSSTPGQPLALERYLLGHHFSGTIYNPSNRRVTPADGRQKQRTTPRSPVTARPKRLLAHLQRQAAPALLHHAQVPHDGGAYPYPL